MAKKRNTKLALASLMAVSAITPVVASADTNGSVTTEAGTSRNTEAEVAKTIDFTVQEESGMLAKFVTGPGALVEQNGQQYIKLNLSDAMLNMVTAVTVDGKTALHESGGKKMVLIPVSADYAPVVVDFAITAPVGAGKYKATLTPNASSIKEVVKVEIEETVNISTADVVKVESLKDGEYKVPFTTLKPDSTETSSMSNHIGAEAKLTVKDGVYTIELTTSEKTNSMITSIKTARNGELVEMDVVNGGRDTATRTVSAPITSLQGKLAANVSYEIPEEEATNLPAGMSRVQNHDFDIVFGEPQLVKEEESSKPTVEKQILPLSVYKDGTTEISIMQGKYIKEEVTVTATEGGGYDVELTFPEGQHLKEVKFNGQTVALTSETTADTGKVQIYTIHVEDLSQLYTLTVDLDVKLPDGTPLYAEVYNVQLQIGEKVKPIPFKDIDGLENYDAIANLYSLGIFKENEKFNPSNPTTRYQFSLMLYRALDVEVPATTEFKDIAKLDEEAQSAIKALNSLGVINGVNDETFAPYNNITRAQTAKMIYRLLVNFGYQDQANATMPFSDVAANDAELNKAAAQLNALGIMTGSNGKLNPNEPVTRNQMAKVLNNVLEVVEGLE